MVHDLIATELVKARTAALQAEVLHDARIRRRSARLRTSGGGLRLALGVRFLSAGYRLLGDTVEVR